jgi:hypothetical protein
MRAPMLVAALCLTSAAQGATITVNSEDNNGRIFVDVAGDEENDDTKISSTSKNDQTPTKVAQSFPGTPFQGANHDMTSAVQKWRAGKGSKEPQVKPGPGEQGLSGDLMKRYGKDHLDKQGGMVSKGFKGFYTDKQGIVQEKGKPPLHLKSQSPKYYTE